MNYIYIYIYAVFAIHHRYLQAAGMHEPNHNFCIIYVGFDIGLCPSHHWAHGRIQVRPRSVQLLQAPHIFHQETHENDLEGCRVV